MARLDHAKAARERQIKRMRNTRHENLLVLSVAQSVRRDYSHLSDGSDVDVAFAIGLASQRFKQFAAGMEVRTPQGRVVSPAQLEAALTQNKVEVTA